MSKEKKMIPELRFPEFKSDGEWEEKSLDEVSNVVASGDLDKDSFSKEKTDVHTFPIYSNSISNEGLYGYNTYSKYPPNSVTITARGTLGIAFVRKNEFVGIGRLLIASDLEDTDSIFLKENWNLFAKVPLENGGIPQLTAIKAKRISLLYPKIEEQQKIAACLSSLDELITAHNDKLTTLKAHKKGLMQNLFPQEGQKTPNYRFKEFKNDGEWKPETIDSTSSLVTDYVANGSFQSLRENANVQDEEGYAFYIRLTDLRAGIGHSGQKFVDQKSYKFLNKSSLHGGELLMANIGANVGEVWQMPKVEFPATLAPNMLMIKFKKISTSDFVFHFLQSGQGQANVSKAISGSGHPKINKTDLKQVILFIPPSEKEQQKIASCLSAVDKLITAQAQKIEELQQHKKGLMQGLFPKIES